MARRAAMASASAMATKAPPNRLKATAAARAPSASGVKPEGTGITSAGTATAGARNATMPSR
ncbi:MAG: hypothetical protein AB1673_08680 [Actinomycetota bacterium]